METILNLSELTASIKREEELNEKLIERISWIKDIAYDYADRPREGLHAIKIFLNDADNIMKKHKKEKKSGNN